MLKNTLNSILILLSCLFALQAHSSQSSNVKDTSWPFWYVGQLSNWSMPDTYNGENFGLLPYGASATQGLLQSLNVMDYLTKTVYYDDRIEYGNTDAPYVDKVHFTKKMEDSRIPFSASLSGVGMRRFDMFFKMHLLERSVEGIHLNENTITVVAAEANRFELVLVPWPDSIVDTNYTIRIVTPSDELLWKKEIEAFSSAYPNTFGAEFNPPEYPNEPYLFPYIDYFLFNSNEYIPKEEWDHEVTKLTEDHLESINSNRYPIPQALQNALDRRHHLGLQIKGVSA